MSRSMRPILATLAIALAAGLTALLGGAASAQSANIDYDLDNDNLIEITTLEQLDAVRYDLFGNNAPINSGDTGYAAYTAAFPSPAAAMGCPAACTGYELAKSLDFNADASYADANTNKTSWTTGDGWTPIGDATTSFRATLDGNGHTISNLYVNITETVTGAAGIARAGLFGVISTGGVVKNVGVTGSVTASVTVTRDADAYAGGLAGWNNGDITDSWADVSVEAETSGPSSAGVTAYAGGLVGFANIRSEILRSYALGDVTADAGGEDPSIAGGLVGLNQGRIGASFATGAVLADSNSGAGNGQGGNAHAGGLLGFNTGTVSASYATGAAEARSRIGNFVENAGGLVGSHVGTVEASYSLGAATISGAGTNSGSGAGGLVGSGTATASYWDTQTSGIADDTDPAGKTTAELQTPTGYAGIYANWNVDYDGDAKTGVSGADDPWHFGTASEYPRLKTFASEVVSVSIVSWGRLVVGGEVTVAVKFSGLVDVNGSPSLAITVGGEVRPASYRSHALNEIIFAYAVQQGDVGQVAVPSGFIVLNGGSINSLSGEPASLAFTGAAHRPGHSVDAAAPSVRYKPPSSLTVGQRIRTIVPITSDTDIASYKLKEGSVLPRTLRLNEDTGYITGRPTRAVGRATVVTIIVCDSELDALGNNPNPNCAEVTLKLPAIIDEEADAPAPEPQLPEVPPLDLSNITVGDAAPSRTLLLALAGAGAALLLAGIGVAAVRRWGRRT